MLVLLPGAGISGSTGERGATCRGSRAAALGMGVVLAALRIALAPALAGPALLRIGALAGLVAAGLATFAALVLALGSPIGASSCGRLRRQPA